VKLTLNVLEKRSDDAEKSWPSYMFGGRIRTSTLLLIVVFLAVWWVYDTYRPEAAPKPPIQQVVPPGFVPDPNYTWVPRSRVQEPTATFTPTPSTTVPPAPSTTEPTTTTAPPPFQLPQLPCLLPAPLCPPTSTPTPSPPLPSQPRPGF
jgi:hypothetical protein